MKISGDIFKASISKGSSDLYRGVVRDFLSSFFIEFTQFKGQVTKEDYFLQVTQNGHNAIVFYSDLVEIAAQVLRLAALLHDIGHFPFSHTFEDEVIIPQKHTRANSKNVPNHEFNSAQISTTVSEAIIVRAKSFFRGDLRLVRNILKSSCELVSSKGVGPAFSALRGILSSDIDADKADYLLRDSTSSGFGIAVYDLDRLIRLFQLCHKDTSYYFRPSIRALSSIESIFFSRYMLYKWVYFHHRVVLSDGLLKDIVRRLSVENNFIPQDKFSWKNYYTAQSGYFDDAAFLSELRKFCCDNPKRKESFEVKCLLERSPMVTPLWKDLFQYRKFSVRLERFLRQENCLSLHSLSERSPHLFLNRLIREFRAKDAIGKLREFIRSTAQRAFYEATKGIRAICYCEFRSFKPYQVKEERPESGDSFFVPAYNVIDREGRLVPIHNLSPLVSNLYSCWMNDVQFWVFLLPYEKEFGKRTPLEKMTKSKQRKITWGLLLEILRDFLIDWQKSGC
jgi:HD superfamily phosphohydrolase